MSEEQSSIDQHSLTDQERAKIHIWLEGRGRNAKCGSCGEDDFVLLDHFLAPPVWRSGPQLFGYAYPMVGLVCQNCGHLQLYSAVRMGAIASADGDRDG